VQVIVFHDRIVSKAIFSIEPIYHQSVLSLLKEMGIKQVPRKIEDFSGCLKGVRLINLAKGG